MKVRQFKKNVSLGNKNKGKIQKPNPKDDFCIKIG
jgi:hypothetical protein